ncbi:hypothetical protein R3P38DRAFT_2788338 [Favolaschia claudopus]|uniref:ABC transmembrane type-1 domain-containing protein n=1 Tax=Favolaschia claudopus TaxID=2862362 RepID=A0AAW0AKV5_9AGAR
MERFMESAREVHPVRGPQWLILLVMPSTGVCFLGCLREPAGYGLLDDDEFDRVAAQRAKLIFSEKCAEPLERKNPGMPLWVALCHVTLRRLLQTTEGLLKKNIGGDVWVVTAMAALQKIDASVQIGMKPRAGTSTTRAMYGLLRTSLARAHEYEKLLNGATFQDSIKALAQLAMPEELDVGLWFTAIIAPAAPVVAAIGLSALFLSWLAQIVFGGDRDTSSTRLDVDMALESYKALDLGDVHKDVRRYADSANFVHVLKANGAEQKVKELIGKGQTNTVTLPFANSASKVLCKYAIALPMELLSPNFNFIVWGITCKGFIARSKKLHGLRLPLATRSGLLHSGDESDSTHAIHRIFSAAMSRDSPAFAGAHLSSPSAIDRDPLSFFVLVLVLVLVVVVVHRSSFVDTRAMGSCY